MTQPDEPPDTAPSRARWRTFVVDRREGAVLVLVDDAERTTDIPGSRVPKSCRVEGAVLRVPLDAGGEAVWEKARRDRVEERRRIAELEDRIKRLRRSDPGGDIVL